jgi:hypothetical protein
MRKFISDLLSGKSDTSSKRFASLFTLLNVIILTYIATFSGNEGTPEYMFDALCLIAGGGLGLTVIEKIFSTRNNKPKE